MTNPQSWNQYAYVSNDPINKFDPLGLDEVEAGGTIYVNVIGSPWNGGLGSWGGGGESSDRFIRWADIDDVGSAGVSGPRPPVDEGGGGGGPTPPRGKRTKVYTKGPNEYRIDCDDELMIGFATNINGPLPNELGEKKQIVIQPNTVAAIKAENDGWLIGLSSPMFYGGWGPFNAKVTSMTLKQDGTFSAATIQAGFEFVKTIGLNALKNAFKVPNAISNLPDIFSLLSGLGLCKE